MILQDSGWGQMIRKKEAFVVLENTNINNKLISERDPRTSRRIERRQFYTQGWVVRRLLPFLAGFDATYVIDHMGYMLESDGLTRGDFERLLRVIENGTGWIKLSGPDRIAKDGNFERLIPWPGPSSRRPPTAWSGAATGRIFPMAPKDTGQILNLLSQWALDSSAREAILSR